MLSVSFFFAALRCTLCLTALVLLQPSAHSQAPTPLAGGAKAVSGAPKPAAVVASKPSWAELTPLQQQSLKPLSASWNGINEGQKRKWLEVSKSYPNLSVADQAVMHSRMNEWVDMSPQQRAAARLNFAKTKELSNQLTVDEKKAKWQTYQSLSPEEKTNLASKAAPKPAGAATAVKPVAPQKLAVTPKGVPPAAPTMSLPSDTLQNVAKPAPAN